MTDVKTSQEAAASTLTGAELVRVVQGGLNARTTTGAIADLVPPPVDARDFLLKLTVDFTITTDQPILMPSDKYIVTDLYLVYTGDVVNNGSVGNTTLRIYEGPNQTGNQVAAIVFQLFGPNDYFGIDASQLSTTNVFFTSSHLYVSTSTIVPSSPEMKADLFVRGFSAA